LVEIRVFPLLPLAMDILSPGDLLDELDTDARPLLLQAGGMAGSRKDPEDVVTLEIAHHVAALACPYMTRFHHQFEVHPLPRSIFLMVIILFED
jgi:hypothetical protein